MINPMNFRNPRRDEFWVSLAGPISNVLQATAFALIIPFVQLLIDKGFLQDQNLLLYFHYLIAFGVTINLALAAFNLIPLFPLDGEKVLIQSLPLHQARKWINLRPHGMSILMGLLVLGWITGGKISIILWWIQIFSWPFEQIYGFIINLIMNVIT